MPFQNIPRLQPDCLISLMASCTTTEREKSAPTLHLPINNMDALWISTEPAVVRIPQKLHLRKLLSAGPMRSSPRTVWDGVLATNSTDERALDAADDASLLSVTAIGQHNTESSEGDAIIYGDSDGTESEGTDSSIRCTCGLNTAASSIYPASATQTKHVSTMTAAVSSAHRRRAKTMRLPKRSSSILRPISPPPAAQGVRAKTDDGYVYLAPCERLVRAEDSNDEEFWASDQHLAQVATSTHVRRPQPSDFLLNVRCKKYANFLSSIEFGVRAHDCLPVTYKTVPNPALARGELAALKCLTPLKSPHILPLLHHLRDQDTGHLILVLPRLSPFRVVEHARNLRGAVRGVLRGLMCALKTVHAAGWVHLDVNANNLLRGDRRKIVLIDFGLAQPLSKYTHAPGANDAETQPRYFPRCGTPGYIAPEVAAGLARDPICDVFSAGVVFAQTLAAYLPDHADRLAVFGARHASPQQVVDAAVDIFASIAVGGQYEPECVLHACECAAGMLTQDPAKRWSVARVLQWCDDMGRHGSRHGWWVSLDTMLEARQEIRARERRYSQDGWDEYGSGGDSCNTGGM